MRNRTEDQVTCLLIRHGETEGNREHRYLGRTDEPLSASGREALLSYKERHGYPEVSYLFASPMRRCLETAGIIYPGLRPIVIPEWEEMDFGRFEYKNYQELAGDAEYQAWLDCKGSGTFPGGESREVFMLRCEKGLERMCRELSGLIGSEEKEFVRAGCIVHGGTIMALLSLRNEERYFDYQAANGRGYVCRLADFRRHVRIEEVAKI